MTIAEIIKRSAEYLKGKGVETPRLQVELLLAHLLKMPRIKVYMDFERVLSAVETETLREWVRRRGQREPLQYITGSTSFCGLELAVNKNVLVPRPETEMLAELAWKFLAGLPPLPPPRGLDVGTGSGCLAIAVAAQVPAARLTAVDISPSALETARQNANHCQVIDRIEFCQSDLFAALSASAQFELIVSNPPYIPSADILTLEPEVREHEPLNALDGGADGLDFYRRLATEAGQFLTPGGRLMLELNDNGATDVTTLFQTAGWQVEPIVHDLNHIPRILIAHKGLRSHDVTLQGRVN